MEVLSLLCYVINKTYYTSQCEVWRDISRAEGEWNRSRYLTADECNKWFIHLSHGHSLYHSLHTFSGQMRVLFVLHRLVFLAYAHTQ